MRGRCVSPPPPLTVPSLGAALPCPAAKSSPAEGGRGLVAPFPRAPFGALNSYVAVVGTGSSLPPVTSTLIWIAVVLFAIGLYLSWTAGRLDRLHARIDAARAALDAQLLRRASVAQELATSGVLDPAASIVLYEAAHAARQAEEEQREVAESELSQALRAVFADAQQVEVVREAPGGEDAANELAQAVRRVPMARRFHNDAVRAARALRRHRTVRWFRLAGHAPFPMAFEMDDEPPAAVAERPTT